MVALPTPARLKLRRPRLNRRQSDALAGYLLASPWIFGFITLTAGPMVFSLILSVLKTDLITPWKFVGLGNFRTLFADDLFYKCLVNTAYFSVFSVVLGLIGSLGLAFLMNVPLKGVRLYRTIYYLPAVLPGAPVALLWLQIFSPERGLANAVLKILGLTPLKWIYNEQLAMPCLILMSLWGIGSSLIIYLAGLQGIPKDLYEAAEIDGAGWAPKLTRVTLPMLSPTIFFNLIMSIIGSFQVFTASFVMTGGGPDNATLTYVLYLYRNAFSYFKFGYASALAWVLFFIILALTSFVLKSSPAWVYYESELR
ncbi:MAG: carbohydrate ABC transporter permease [Anaerolineae bacterium]